jgi:imidazolonepropionase-like amidohydrolase
MPAGGTGKKIIFRSARIFDGSANQLLEEMDVLVVDGIVEDVSPRPTEIDATTEVVECAGRTLMPGLIDAHVHVYAASLNIGRVVQSPMSYLAHFAATFLHGCLDRGFTTVRDVGGADVGLASAIKEGLLGLVPRLYYGGRRGSSIPSTSFSRFGLRRRSVPSQRRGRAN